MLIQVFAEASLAGTLPPPLNTLPAQNREINNATPFNFLSS